MLGDLSTYSLRDLVPFTAEVYFRLFVRHNEAMWPAHILTCLLGIAVLWLAWRGRGRWVGALVGALWVWVGYTFHLELYANLNWAAEYFGWAFIAQGVLLLAYGFSGGLDSPHDQPHQPPQLIGLGLAAFGVMIFPFIGPLAGREWAGIEIFGIAPDPTAITTLGVVLMAGRARWLLLIIPVLWAVNSGATAWVMQAPSGLVTPLCALIALGVTLWRSARALRR